MMIGLLDVVVSLAQVWATKHAIDVASHTIEGDVVASVAIMGALVLCGFALGMSETWVRNILGVRAQNRMQRQMLARLLRAEWKGREELHSGDVINRLEQDVNQVVKFLTETLPNTVSVLAMFIGAFIYLFSMDSTLALIIVFVLPVFILLSKVYVRRMRSLSREVRNSDSRVQSLLQETIQNRMLVKTLESEDVMVGKLDEQHRQLQHNVVKRTMFSLFSNLILNFGFSFSYLLAFGWSALRMSAGTLTFGGMTAFLQLVNKIQAPARNLTRLAPAFVQVFTAAERLMRLEEIPLEEQGTPILLDAPCGIRLDDVTFAYADDKEHPVVEHLSFDFLPATCTAILGETGAGKTTIIRLIQALLHPDAGYIYIYNKVSSHTDKVSSHSDNVSSHSDNVSSHSDKVSSHTDNVLLHSDKVSAHIVSPLTRCNIVYVPQGNTLLSGTIRDNLLLGKEDATDTELREVLRIVCADFVFSLPEGLDTICSEQGGGLSEGQAQRICIARALLRGRSILLLDEATSALDPDTERQLLANLLSTNRHTVLFITHRPAVVEYCTSVLEIKRIRPQKHR